MSSIPNTVPKLYFPVADGSRDESPERELVLALLTSAVEDRDWPFIEGPGFEYLADLAAGFLRRGIEAARRKRIRTQYVTG